MGLQQNFLKMNLFMDFNAKATLIAVLSISGGRRCTALSKTSAHTPPPALPLSGCGSAGKTGSVRKS